MPIATDPAIDDDTLVRALGVYAGLVEHVLADPARWLGADEDPPESAGLPSRVLNTVRDRAFGQITPASPAWTEQPLSQRVDWWVNRIGVSAGLAAAAPRFAGALADRLPLQAALGASAAGLAVCAAAREHGRRTPTEWVPLLAQVLFNRTLGSVSAPVPSSADTERDLEAAAVDPSEPPSGLATLGYGAQRAVRTLWRLARTFLEVQDLLEERPRGGLLARTLAKLPVVGVAGGWLDERAAIRKAARHTQRLLT